MPEYHGRERRKRPRVKTEKLEVYVSPAFYDTFRDTVAKEGLTVSQVVSQLCHQYLKARGITLI